MKDPAEIIRKKKKGFKLAPARKRAQPAGEHDFPVVAKPLSLEDLKAKTDVAAGAKLFEKNCANCHQLANQGAKIGPQLDGIGARGLDRLLEDVLDPNRNIDQAFRATTVVLKSGQVVTGLLLRQEGAVLILADAQGKEVRIPEGTVEERTVSQMSPMPANFVDQVTEKEFYHLMAYLLAQRAADRK